MPSSTLLKRITDYANRADPYPLYKQLHETPVIRQDSGVYLVGGYWEIRSLLQDARLSSDPRRSTLGGTDDLTVSQEDPDLPPTFPLLDPPEHDRMRRITMRPFGPPHSPDRVSGMRDEITGIVSELIDGLRGKDTADLVDEFAYPFPVTVICRLLGVPREDETRFRGWSDMIVAQFDNPGDPTAGRHVAEQGRRALHEYLSGLVEDRYRKPGDDLLSGLATDIGPDGPLTTAQLVALAGTLLVAGHETTVNLVANGMLTLLRHPQELERVRKEPSRIVPAVEEVLRYEPPVHMPPNRTALADIDIAGTTIPKGSTVVLVLAAGSRDPRRFTEPDRFDPTRENNEHLGFGYALHYCYGAPLARLEAQIALTELTRRLENPRLVEDPPPYRQSPSLRGPRHLPVAFDDVGA